MTRTIDLGGSIDYSARVGESEEPWTLPVISVRAYRNDALYTEEVLDSAIVLLFQTLGGSTTLSEGQKSYADVSVVDTWNFN